MHQVGPARDNAALESFFALLQKNVLDRCQWATRDELRAGLITWIERTYHRRRRQDRLSRLAPSSTSWPWTTRPLTRRDDGCHLHVHQSRSSHFLGGFTQPFSLRSSAAMSRVICVVFSHAS